MWFLFHSGFLQENEKSLKLTQNLRVGQLWYPIDTSNMFDFPSFKSKGLNFVFRVLRPAIRCLWLPFSSELNFHIELVDVFNVF